MINPIGGRSQNGITEPPGSVGAYRLTKPMVITGSPGFPGVPRGLGSDSLGFHGLALEAHGDLAGLMQLRPSLGPGCGDLLGVIGC